MPDSFALMSFHAPCPGNCRLATYPGFFRSFSRTEVHFGIFPILLLISSVPNSRMGPPSPRFPAGAACASGSRAGSAGVTAGGGVGRRRNPGTLRLVPVRQKRTDGTPLEEYFVVIIRSKRAGIRQSDENTYCKQAREDTKPPPEDHLPFPQGVLPGLQNRLQNIVENRLLARQDIHGRHHAGDDRQLLLAVRNGVLVRADLDQVEELAALVLNRIGADLLEIGLKPP